jgi:MazG family protein
VTGREDILAHVPDGPVPSHLEGRRLLDLVRVMARLRGPDGCPWDHEQTHASLARHLLEEAHEAVDAIDRDDLDGLRDELGDVLLQVAFHARIAADGGGFDIDDVAEAIVAKLIRRHPHVFGDVEVASADDVLANWERIKADEVGERRGLEADIPPALPSLARAAKVQRRAAAWGFEWPPPDAVVETVADGVRDVMMSATEGPDDSPGGRDAEGALGDVLWAIVAIARHRGLDAEAALRRSVRAFAGRFDRWDELARRTTGDAPANPS